MAILSDYSLVNTRVNFTQHFSLPQTLRFSNQILMRFKPNTYFDRL